MLQRLLGLSPSRPQLHQRGVDGDAMQPRRKAGAAFESLETAESVEKRLLHGVARVFFGTENPPRQRQQAPAVGTDDVVEGGFVAGA